MDILPRHLSYYRGRRYVLSWKTRKALERLIDDRNHDALRRFCIGLMCGISPAKSLKMATQQD